MDRVLCCALGVSLCLLAGCSHTTPIAKARGTSISSATKLPNRADLVARIETVEAEAERAKQAGDNTAALNAYRRLLLLDPGHADAHHHLAVAADMERDFSVAEQHYRAALAREPQNPHLHTSLGWSLFLQHRDGEAQGELRRALELDPEHATALYNMGWLAAHRGDEAEALEYFRRGGTEAQAQALLAKVQLELEDRSSRNETQRAVARLKAPSPRGRTPRNEEPAESTVQARAEFDEERPAPLPRTVSLETEPTPVSEPLEASSPLDEELDPRPLAATADPQELATRHLAERPAIQTVAYEAETPDAVVDEAVEDEPGVDAVRVDAAGVDEPGVDEPGETLSAVGRSGGAGEEGGSEPLSPLGSRPVPITRQAARSPSAGRRASQPTTTTEPDVLGGPGDVEGGDWGLRRGAEDSPPTESWPGFSPRTLATVGRVMFGKPPGSRESPSSPVRDAASAASGLEGATAPPLGARAGEPSRAQIEPEMLNAARVGLNLGQPATRRFHAPSAFAADSE
jgi:Tfp pilus assembly protein PilF